MIKKFLIITLVLCLFVGTVQAQTEELPEPGMLPGHPLYFLETWGESVVTFFTFGEDSKAERLLFLSEKRLSEANELMARGEDELAERAISRYENQFGQALEKAKEAREKGLDVDEVFLRVSEATLKHQDVLMDVYDRVPEQSKEAIQRAMQEGLRGHEEALDSISEQDRERVVEKMREVEQRLEETPLPDLPELEEEVRERIPDGLEEEVRERIPDVPGNR